MLAPGCQGEHTRSGFLYPRSFFDAANIPSAHFHVEDAASFVERAAPRTGDVLVVDAYGTSELASGCVKREFFAALARVLRPGGLSRST